MTIVVSNLPHEVTRLDLLELFEEYGPIKRVLLPTYRDTGKVREFAFVEMDRKAQEAAAISELNGSQWMGNKLQVHPLILY